MSKKNTAEKIERPVSLIVEEERLNSVIDRLEFDLELANRKNTLLENARKKHLSAEDRERAIINKARYEAQTQAARKARDARENLFEEKKRAFLDLLNSGKACMPFKSLDQLNRYKQDDAC
ncbi:MAG: hypothetical protein KJ811_02350, partial [Candidatus Margulisbacteria bacterium]|nr:hypothetical protein [Candidatus Margulisiibacteriota bacterium]